MGLIDNLLQSIVFTNLYKKGVDLDECIKNDKKYDYQTEYKTCCALADYLMDNCNKMSKEEIDKFIKLCSELDIKDVTKNNFIGKLMDYLLKKVRYIENEYILDSTYV